MKKSLFCTLSFLILFMLNCDISQRTELGAEIPEGMETVKLSSVLNNPSDFYEKEFILEGIIINVCHSGCDFQLRDGTTSVTMYPLKFKVLNMKRSQRVRVLTQIQKGERDIFLALGMQVIK